VKPGEAEQIRTRFGYGQVSDLVLCETPLAVPPGVDTKISSPCTARQNGHPAEKVVI
jgi:hypothetical protein